MRTAEVSKGDAEAISGADAMTTVCETVGIEEVKLAGSLTELKRWHVNRVCAHVLKRDHAMTVDCEGANRAALVHMIVMRASIGIAVIDLKEGENEGVGGLTYRRREAPEETLSKPQK